MDVQLQGVEIDLHRSWLVCRQVPISSVIQLCFSNARHSKTVLDVVRRQVELLDEREAPAERSGKMTKAAAVPDSAGHAKDSALQVCVPSAQLM